MMALVRMIRLENWLTSSSMSTNQPTQATQTNASNTLSLPAGIRSRDERPCTCRVRIETASAAMPTPK